MNDSTRRLIHVALFAAVMAVSAFIRIPVGPVPLTLQSAAALTAGYVLGPAGGAASMALYMAVGLAGVPVFAQGGGPMYVLTPTFGYILGFIACAALTGWLAGLNRRGSVPAAYAIMLAGLTAIYIPGVIWLGITLGWLVPAPLPFVRILQAGLLIPLPGNLITAIPAAVVSIRLREKLS